MPVEIRELQITTVVREGAPSSSSTSSSGPSANSDEVVAKCVEQVLDILKQKMER
jgi:hypothetical protein